MFALLLAQTSPADWVALALFTFGWSGYAWWADRRHGLTGLRGATHGYRLRWAREMVRRENRITDAALTANLAQSISFYASTTTYIIAGLLAVAGALDKLVSVTAELPFARVAGRELVEIKILLLAGIFVYAYFKFTWSLRQFNLLSILIGGAPRFDRPDAELESYAQKFATLNLLAGDEFNRGLRAYYFGLAAMTWFVSPMLMIAFTLVVLGVLWRRDFHSHTLAALED